MNIQLNQQQIEAIADAYHNTIVNIAVLLSDVRETPEIRTKISACAQSCAILRHALQLAGIELARPNQLQSAAQIKYAILGLCNNPENNNRN